MRRRTALGAGAPARRCDTRRLLPSLWLRPAYRPPRQTQPLPHVRGCGLWNASAGAPIRPLPGQ